MRRLDRRVRRFAMILLLGAVFVGVLNLVALASTHISPWAGLAVLVTAAALPFVPVPGVGK